jgi:hypothetical protein
MQPILAHHDMLEALDFLGLNPVTPLFKRDWHRANQQTCSLHVVFP